MSARLLFTIGHSNHPIERFLDLLAQHSVEVVADVRSIPISSRNPQFNRDVLKTALAEHGVKYLFLGKELGARRTEREAYEGRIALYDRIARLPAFREGLERIKGGAENYRIVLMCAEKDPLDCHRTLLVCRFLRHEMPGRIRHILVDGQLEFHEEAERRLVAVMGMNADQAEMFAGEDEPVLDRAYRKRGLKIAYEEEAGDGN